MKVLITGAHGQLGLALQRRLATAHSVLACDRARLDISDAAACTRLLAQERPDWVLNCAAYTAVDRAEQERDLAYAINAQGPEHLARACADHGATLLHFSTDYVFDGRGTRPYVETDATAPLGVYGASKLAGEEAVQAPGGHYVLRLSWVYGNDGNNFYKTMLRLAAERPELRVVADQFGVPNYTADLAEAIARVVQQTPEAARHNAGLYHLSASGQTSWHGFAQAIIEGAGLAGRVKVSAITSAEYPTPAERPRYSVLDSRLFEARFGHAPPPWQDALMRCLRDKQHAA